MATKKIFQEFNSVSSQQWKQQIQYELKGVDYNQTVVWETLEGIKVKPFYHIDEFEKKYQIPSSNGFEIVQKVFVHDEAKSNQRAVDAVNRGAEQLQFTIENTSISFEKLLQNLPKENTSYALVLPFLSVKYTTALANYLSQNGFCAAISIDPIGQLASDGNWFENLDSDFEKLNTIASQVTIPFLSINSGVYQNAGANIVQQLAYTLAHLNEYFNRLKLFSDNQSQSVSVQTEPRTTSNENQLESLSVRAESRTTITIEVAVGSNYFFEIAKIRALRLLFNTLAKEYGNDINCLISVTPTLRNKALYDYNVNMLRTTTECMSAILGGADAVANVAYDSIYHKDNEFGDRISRNQLLILKNESYFGATNNSADGSYYIESITQKLAEKALELFKEIENGGGFITQLIEGKIQKKINESAQKEQELFDAGKEVLLGTNKYPNTNDRMKQNLELYPFVKHNPRKTLITPIIQKRLAEKIEQERLETE